MPNVLSKFLTRLRSVATGTTRTLDATPEPLSVSICSDDSVGSVVEPQSDSSKPPENVIAPLDVPAQASGRAAPHDHVITKESANPVAMEVDGTRAAPTPELSPDTRRLKVIDAEYSVETGSAVRELKAQNDLRNRAEEIVSSMERRLAEKVLPGMAFDTCRQAAREQAIVIRAGELEPTESIWFIGDVHGDLLALDCALAYIRGFPGAEAHRLVFLGDLFDDGDYSYEVVLRVLDLICQNPKQICLLAGNHDEALAFDGARFTSSVDPSDFTSWLNENLSDAVIRRLGQLIVELFKLMPRALFFPDGLLIAHGGVPHTDLCATIQCPNDLNAPECLQDFVWTRAHERAKRRIPNRMTRGCEFGIQDFEQFCIAASQAIGQPVARMLRGHDHVENRFALYERYVKNPVLTINTLSRKLPREVFGPFERMPCIARWIPDQLPEVHRVNIPPDVVREVYRGNQAPI